MLWQRLAGLDIKCTQRLLASGMPTDGRQNYASVTLWSWKGYSHRWYTHTHTLTHASISLHRRVCVYERTNLLCLFVWAKNCACLLSRTFGPFKAKNNKRNHFPWASTVQKSREKEGSSPSNAPVTSLSLDRTGTRRLHTVVLTGSYLVWRTRDFAYAGRSGLPNTKTYQQQQQQQQ